MIDYKDEIAKNYGKYETPESKNVSEKDFEESFIEYIKPVKESDYYSELGSDFTNVKFAEIDNSEIEDFTESFKKHFK